MSTEHLTSESSPEGSKPDIRKFTLSTLVREYSGGILIPMIQRDYAQGRSSWENSRIRFLKDLRKALSGVKSLHLDFVYGVTQVEDGFDAFCPLDGQQRLTTLFLLHWYLAARDGCFGKFQETFQTAVQESKFTYQVRPGGRSFFQSLVKHAPDADESTKSKPAAWIREQSWFRTIWERDPSVTGALTMLDAIHKHFMNTPGVGYDQLADGDRITFQRLDLDAARLHDDLYLRMNARGRPLTTFETFKARYEKRLDPKKYDTQGDAFEPFFAVQSAISRCTVQTPEQLSHKIDTDWLDFIWKYYSPKNSAPEDTSTVDTAFINLFRAVALVSLPPKQDADEKDADEKDADEKDADEKDADEKDADEKDADEKDADEKAVAAVTFLSQGKKGEQGKQIYPDYDDFENGRWLTPLFTTHLIHVLEACEKTKENALVFDTPWFGKGRLLDRIVRHDSSPTLTDFLQFAACVRFLTRYGPELDEAKVSLFQSWMRVVRNLIINSEVRVDTFRQILSGLDQLLEGSGNVLNYLSESAKRFTGLNEDQTKEERRKAKLILANEGWMTRILVAESHGYFCGQIDFLLEFSGADPKAQDHTLAQNNFDTYLQRSREMFGPSGLNSKPDYLWQRALLAIHDFFAGAGWQIWSFLEDERGSAPAWNTASWKRLLRDNNARRNGLKTLWDRMASETLEQIAGDLPAELWRKALCSRADLWSYCHKHLVRREDRNGNKPQFYLLSAKRRRAAYAELFTYRLMKLEALEQNKSRFAPLEFVHLVDDTGSDDDPYLKFEMNFADRRMAFLLHCQYANDDGFSLWTVAKEFPSELLPVLDGLNFVSETHGTTEFQVLRQHPGDPLDGASFLDSVATALRGILHPS